MLAAKPRARCFAHASSACPGAPGGTLARRPERKLCDTPRDARRIGRTRPPLHRRLGGLHRHRQNDESHARRAHRICDEAGRTLYNLPKAKIVDTDAPVRFLPEYDNLVLGHAHRSRILPGAYRKLILLGAGRVRATVLVDGFAVGAWKIERDIKAATLVIEMFQKVKKAFLAEEGKAVLRFAAPDATSHAIQ